MASQYTTKQTIVLCEIYSKNDNENFWQVIVV